MQHPNYKRVVGIIAVLFLILIVATLGYQYFSSKQQTRKADTLARAHYQLDQDHQTQEYLKTLFALKSKPTTKAEVDAMNAYFTSHPANTSGMTPQDFVRRVETTQEQAYQDWKVSQK